MIGASEVGSVKPLVKEGQNVNKVGSKGAHSRGAAVLTGQLGGGWEGEGGAGNLHKKRMFQAYWSLVTSCC